MKRTIKITMIIIISFISVAFIQADFNFYDWSEADRIRVIIIALVLTALLAIHEK